MNYKYDHSMENDKCQQMLYSLQSVRLKGTQHSHGTYTAANINTTVRHAPPILTTKTELTYMALSVLNSSYVHTSIKGQFMFSASGSSEELSEPLVHGRTVFHFSMQFRTSGHQTRTRFIRGLNFQSLGLLWWHLNSWSILNIFNKNSVLSHVSLLK